MRRRFHRLRLGCRDYWVGFLPPRYWTIFKFMRYSHEDTLTHDMRVLFLWVTRFERGSGYRYSAQQAERDRVYREREIPTLLRPAALVVAPPQEEVPMEGPIDK